MTGADLLAEVERQLRVRFAQEPDRASVSFVGVEPLQVLRFFDGDTRVYVTVGMSRRPMTAAADQVVAANGPRAELLVRVHDPHGVYLDVWRQLAVLAAAPAVEGVVYTAGMTVDLGQALAPGSGCSGAVLQDAGMPRLGNDANPVDVLALVPATATELAWSRVHGTQALQERWWGQGVDLLDLARAAADLS